MRTSSGDDEKEKDLKYIYIVLCNYNNKYWIGTNNILSFSRSTGNTGNTGTELSVSVLQALVSTNRVKFSFINIICFYDDGKHRDDADMSEMVHKTL